MAKQLTKPALQAIKEDADLYAEVAKELAVSPLYLPKLLRDNNIKLTQIGVLALVSKKLGVSPEKLTEEKHAKLVA